MCCTTLLSMWLSNTSTTAMVMPIVEAVLQELVSAEEEQLVASNSGIEEAEPISTVCWSSSTLCPSALLMILPSGVPALRTPHLCPSSLSHTSPCHLKLSWDPPTASFSFFALLTAATTAFSQRLKAWDQPLV